MKNMIKILSIIFVVVGVGGCSKWNQDPMEGQPWPNNSGKPSPGGEKPKDGLPPDNIIIDTVSSYTFQESFPGSFKIEARILLPGYSAPDISIKNKDDFPYAAFDPTTGIFSWTPPFGTAGSEDSVLKQVEIQVVFRNPEAVIVKNEAVPVMIKKTFLKPTIISVPELTSIREGESTKFSVVVRDQNATSSELTWPVLVLHPPYSGNNLAGFTKVSSKERLPNGDFVFDLTLNLNGVEVTDTRVNFAANLVAYSFGGIASESKYVDVIIFTSFSDLTSTWRNEISVFTGQPINYSFVIFDPKDEGVLQAPTFTNLPPGAVVDCQSVPSNEDSQQHCVFEWTPAVGTPLKVHAIDAEVVVKNRQEWGNPPSEVKKLSFPIRVLPPKSAPTPPSETIGKGK
ncbi:MAG: hypothetical protein IPM97_06520 [Bdellovibrionaceae bacterium]|nr:hypothetical protein [Pseudobdellovibrionaceae bacterium]